MRYKIANIVAYTETSETLNLTQISQTLPNTEYVPEIYFALIYRIDDPKISILVNKSGKLIFVGGKSVEDIERARDIFFHELKVIGYSPLTQQIYVRNMVAVYDLSRRVDLRQLIQRSHSKHLDYNPDRFRAVYLKNQDPKFTATIYRSGKIVILGTRSIRALQSAIRIVIEIVNQALGETN
jgi:transcription initiation factor TFIID TATA-box-binding protein